jgi:hypothetical protein
MSEPVEVAAEDISSGIKVRSVNERKCEKGRRAFLGHSCPFLFVGCDGNIHIVASIRTVAIVSTTTKLGLLHIVELVGFLVLRIPCEFFLQQRSQLHPCL